MLLILEGVNELRQNTVTKATLAEFRELQAAEMRTFVRAENAPLHNAVGKLCGDVTRLSQEAIENFDRVGRLEAKVDTLQSGGGEASSSSSQPNPFDPARRQVAFIGFEPGSSTDERIAAMDAFMTKHFADIRPVCTNIYPDKDGNPTNNGFVEVVDSKLVRRVTKIVKDRSLKLDGRAGVAIKPALTAIDRNRNWALKKATTLVREHPAAHGKTVDFKRAEGRGVYVDNVQVFSQEPRFSKGGTFHGSFVGLKLDG